MVGNLSTGQGTPFWGSVAASQELAGEGALAARGSGRVARTPGVGQPGRGRLLLLLGQLALGKAFKQPLQTRHPFSETGYILSDISYILADVAYILSDMMDFLPQVSGHLPSKAHQGNAKDADGDQFRADYHL